ncbi:MAG: methionine--tRNA ligase [Patescibacteria group bacterium]
MTENKSFYITTTLPYVNAEAHIGHALEFIRADVIARVKKIDGYEVFLGMGTDEHGAKIERNAKALSLPPQEFVDKVSLTFKNLMNLLGISSDVHFHRTTDPKHIESAQGFWKICKKNGYIYKKNYKIKYCVGCELEKTDSELVDGKCPIHPSLVIEEIEEENYFFKFSEFQKPLLDFYEKNPDFVVPSFRFNEIKSFVKGGLNDFSISRLKSKMSWGVEVPDDSNHVMYVWFDALVSYISNIGWPKDEKSFEKWWIKTGGVIQYCGKDNLRQQSAMWQAMLMSVGLPNSRQIVINGFVTGEGGIKMSKSIGNTVDPLEIIKEYGTDALRYFVLREVHPFEDSPFTMEKFKESYNAHLANGLGNLVSRVMKMAETNEIRLDHNFVPQKDPRHEEFYASFEINRVCDDIWLRIQHADKFIQDNQPFKVIKTDEQKGKEQISYLLTQIAEIEFLLRPILPQTSEKIAQALKDNKIAEALFMRK